MPEIRIERGRVAYEKDRLEAEFLDMGRARDLSVIFFDTQVSRHHLRISAEKSGYTIEDVGSRFGTRLDGKTLVAGRKYRLRDGAGVELGSSAFTVHIAKDERRPVFRILRGGDGARRESGLLLRDRTGYKLSTATGDVFSSLANQERLPQRMVDALVAMVRCEEAAVAMEDASGAVLAGVVCAGRGRNAERNRARIVAAVTRKLKEGKRNQPVGAAGAKGSQEIWIPITGEHRLTGVIYAKAGPHGFSPEDRNFLIHFERILAVADENAKRIQEIREAGEIEKARTAALKTEVLRFYTRQKLIGTGKAHRAIVEAVEDFKNINKEVLITGESGTGKDVVARALHFGGPRKNGPFVAVHLGALPRELILSEIFGHEKGAFTGAGERKIGKFELAKEGTLFLDEIGEVPQEVQVMLLRVLETKEFQRIGGNRVIRADFRLVCATNKDLEEAVRLKTFREDLLYRINFLRIHLPPLRERREDIPALSSHLVEALAGEMQIRKKEVGPEALRVLLSYGYPGNIRELKNILGRAMILARGDGIASGDLPQEIRERGRVAATAPPESIPKNMDDLRALEKVMIQNTLEETGGNIKGAAERVGISRQALYQKLDAYCIPRRPVPKNKP